MLLWRKSVEPALCCLPCTHVRAILRFVTIAHEDAAIAENVSAAQRLGHLKNVKGTMTHAKFRCETR